MFTATKDRPLATTITGSLPRPSWFNSYLQGRSFSVAMGDGVYREQYMDAVASLISELTGADWPLRAGCGRLAAVRRV
jgi:5-methyltetrahydropteroyltriglutamate--homocysteine methyltransferase